MPVQFTARSRNGETTTGLIEAGSVTDARRQLLDKGLFPLQLNEVASPAQRTALATPTRAKRSRIRKTDLLMVTCQLAVMTRSKIDLAEALRNVSEHCPNLSLRQVMTQVYEDVISGKSLSTALQRQVNVFGDPYVSSIAAAEASGTIAASLDRLTELLRNEIRLRGAVVSALMYPIALIGIAAVVVVALFMFVLPQFAQVFSDLGTAPPVSTRILLSLSTLLGSNLPVLCGALLIGILALKALLQSPAARTWWHTQQLNNPILRKASRPLLVGQSFRRLSTMLQTGVPLLDALRLSRKSVYNVLFQSMFTQMAAEVEAGRGLSGTLIQAPFLPPGAAQMVRTAETSGNLGEVLETVGSFYEEEGERELKQLVKLLEPVIVVLMGVLVSGVVASVILPLLDISSVAQ